jgi:hypothetical protein
MSTYTTMQGELTFPTLRDYQAAVKQLQDGRWMDAEGFFLDDVGHHAHDEAATAPDSLTINIPYSLYRNIDAAIGDISEGASGYIVSTCTDGCFDGAIYRDGKWTNCDLEDWAKKQPGRMAAPADQESDAYLEWLNDIEQDFFDTQLALGDEL